MNNVQVETGKHIKLNIIEKLFLLAVVFNSGTDFSHDYSVSALVMVFAFVMMILSKVITLRQNSVQILTMIIVACVIWTIQYTIYPAAEGIVNIYKYAALMLMCFVYTSSQPERNMVRFAYVIKIIVFFMFLSTAFFLLALVGFGLPTIQTASDHPTVFYLFGMSENPFFGFMGYRNSGMYWEPGMYMVYLNLVLLYYLFNKTIIRRRRLIVISICGFSILTTGSVTGYALALIILATYSFFASTNNNKYVKLITILGFISVFIALIPTLSSLLETKMATDRSESSFTMRMADMFLGFKLFTEKPILGYGIVNDMYSIYTKSEFSSIRGNSNGLINILINMGLVGFVFYSYCVTKFSKRLSYYLSNKAILFLTIIWIVISSLNEPLTMHPFVFFILGIGLAERPIKAHRNILFQQQLIR